MRKDQTKIMVEIVRLTEAIKRTEIGIGRHQDTINRMHEKLMRRQTELRVQKFLLKWNLP